MPIKNLGVYNGKFVKLKNIELGKKRAHGFEFEVYKYLIGSSVKSHPRYCISQVWRLKSDS